MVKFSKCTLPNERININAECTVKISLKRDKKLSRANSYSLSLSLSMIAIWLQLMKTRNNSSNLWEFRNFDSIKGQWIGEHLATYPMRFSLVTTSKHPHVRLRARILLPKSQVQYIVYVQIVYIQIVHSQATGPDVLISLKHGFWVAMVRMQAFWSSDPWIECCLVL